MLGNSGASGTGFQAWPLGGGASEKSGVAPLILSASPESPWVLRLYDSRCCGLSLAGMHPFAMLDRGLLGIVVSGARRGARVDLVFNC
jgi:hypothetical protein